MELLFSSQALFPLYFLINTLQKRFEPHLCLRIFCYPRVKMRPTGLFLCLRPLVCHTWKSARSHSVGLANRCPLTAFPFQLVDLSGAVCSEGF